MKKVFKTILTICMLFMLVMPVSADEKMINFVSPDGKLIFETNYNENDYYLEINSDDSFIIYTVYDNDDNFKESWSFEKLEYLKTSTFGINVNIIMYRFDQLRMYNQDILNWLFFSNIFITLL